MGKFILSYPIEEFKQLVIEGKKPDYNYFYKRNEKEKQYLTEELYQLSIFLKKKLDICIYLMYGTLLGAIRDKDFIPFDNDVDIGYISKFSNKECVIAEWNNLMDFLEKKRLLLKKCSTIGQAHILSPSHKNKYDFWTSWVSPSGISIVPFFDNSPIIDIMLPLKRIEFKGYKFFAPNKPEDLLDIIYHNWRTPMYSNWNKLDGRNLLNE